MLLFSKVLHVIAAKSENAEKKYNICKNKQQSFMKPANMHEPGPSILSRLNIYKIQLSEIKN